MLKAEFVLTIIVTSLFLLAITAKADIVYLETGAKLEGIIEEETEDTVIISLDIGKITYSKEEIEFISKSSEKENEELKGKWLLQKERREKKQEGWEKFTAEQEAKGLVFYEGKWITKEEFEGISEHKTNEEQIVVIRKEEVSGAKEKNKLAKLNYIVKCEDGIHSYAVRLPADYNEETRFPVLFLFEPCGDGRGITSLFKEATDKHNWIVVGSLDAKNGPWETIFEAQEAMLKDIPKRFSVDRRRFYAGGFSGGAKMSFAIAYRNPRNFRGIIACSASYEEWTFGGLGNVPEKIVIYHTAGEDDFNLDYVREANKKLQSLGIESKLVEFDGGHEMPPLEIISDALNWIE